MLIFSVSFQFYRMIPEGNPTRSFCPNTGPSQTHLNHKPARTSNHAPHPPPLTMASYKPPHPPPLTMARSQQSTPLPPSPGLPLSVKLFDGVPIMEREAGKKGSEEQSQHYMKKRLLKLKSRSQRAKKKPVRKDLRSKANKKMKKRL